MSDTAAPLPARTGRLAADAPLRLVSLIADTPTLLRQTRLAAEGVAEPRYAVHAAFRRFFGAEHEPLTFYVEPSRDYRTLIRAYSCLRLAELEKLAATHLSRLIAHNGIDAAALMPFRFGMSEETRVVPLATGMRVMFALRCAPLRTGRPRDGSGPRGTLREADAFAADRRALLARLSGEAVPILERQAILAEARRACYRAWLVERLLGCRLEEFALDRFQIEQVLRGTAGQRRTWRLPVADVRGILVIEDAADFRALLLGGIGRHKAYGLGMLRFRPFAGDAV